MNLFSAYNPIKWSLEMKRLAPILGFMFILLIPASFLTADLGIDLWKPYMSEPRDQSRNTSKSAPVCNTYASLFCVEGLYNYYYDLGEYKVTLNADSANAYEYASEVLYSCLLYTSPSPRD